jgi:hypothetical protein
VDIILKRISSLDDQEVFMAWETVVLKVEGAKKLNRIHRQSWMCPKCERTFFTIPVNSKITKGATSKKSNEDEREFLVLICDRCGQFIAFEGCIGECSSFPKPKCEVCGKYYCGHCGIVEDIDMDDKHLELRYCYDHIPEWYKNR